MRTLLIIALFFSILAVGYSQDNKNEPDPFTFVKVFKEPEPINMHSIITEYPKEAKEKGIEGVVVLRILVDEKGNYVKHIVMQSPHPILTEAIEKQVHKLKFTPALDENRQPIKVWVTIPFRFKLVDELEKK